MPPIRRREVFRPSRATADRAASARGAPPESAGAGGAPHLRPRPGSALTECAGRGMPPPLAEPAWGGGMHGDGLAPDGNLVIAERGGDAARRPPPRRVRLRRHSPRPDMQTHTTHHASCADMQFNSLLSARSPVLQDRHADGVGAFSCSYRARVFRKMNPVSGTVQMYRMPMMPIVSQKFETSMAMSRSRPAITGSR